MINKLFIFSGPATYLMDILLIPIKRYCHAMGIDISVFVDDSLNVSMTRAKAEACLKFIIYIFSAAGWQLATEKTLGPTQQIYYLGFEINTIQMSINAPYFKIIVVSNDISAAIAKSHEKGNILTKDLAHILGILCHMIVSHGNIVRICTRACQQQLGEVVQASGWEGKLALTDRMVHELTLVRDCLPRFFNNILYFS